MPKQKNVRFLPCLLLPLNLEPTPGFEPGTSSLPRKCSAPELCGQCGKPFSCSTTFLLERVMGIEPTSSAWKAEVLPLNYTRLFLSISVPLFRRAKILTVLITYQTVRIQDFYICVLPKEKPYEPLSIKYSLRPPCSSPGCITQKNPNGNDKLPAGLPLPAILPCPNLPPPSTVYSKIWWRG